MQRIIRKIILLDPSERLIIVSVALSIAYFGFGIMRYIIGGD